MTFGELVSQLSYEAWPSGESENLIAIHRRFFIEALYDAQKNISCLRENNVNVIASCGSYFKCGMTVVPKPRGHILSVSVIDKLDSYTGLESADAEEDWCSEIQYAQVDFCHLSNYQRLCEQCSGVTSLAANAASIVSSIFGVFRIKRRYPAPTDVGFEALPPLQEGFHYPQAATDADGRSPSGVWANHGDQIYVAPWIQSTEALVIRWNGIKRNWSDADLVDDDPKFLQTVRTHVSWQHEKAFGDKDMAKSLFADLWGTPATTGTVGLIPDLIHECHEENRKRSCDETMGAGTGGGGARGMSPDTSGSTGKSYTNDVRVVRSATCPTGQTGTAEGVREIGSVSSVFSVADANAKAVDQAQAEANSRLVCEDAPTVYLSIAVLGRASCPGADDDYPAADGPETTYPLAAGAYESSVSQQAADDAAQDAADLAASYLLVCTYWNKSGSYTGVCTSGTIGPDVVIPILAHTQFSALSRDDADTKATQVAQAEAATQLVAGCGGYEIGNSPQGSPVSINCAPLNCVTRQFSSNYIVPANRWTTQTSAGNEVADLLRMNLLAQSEAQQINQASVNAQCQAYTSHCSGPGGFPQG